MIVFIRKRLRFTPNLFPYFLAHSHASLFLADLSAFSVKKTDEPQRKEEKENEEEDAHKDAHEMKEDPENK
jgi:hypothetical protein